MRAWKNGRRIYQQLWPYLKQGDRILEIGAGIGCNVKAFEVEGWESCGIEPHEGFCEYGSQVLRSPLQRQSLEDLPQEPIADVILLVHVIEHFKSPRQALERIRGLLRPGGRLYIECPNLAAPFAPRGKLFHYAHIHNFTPQTLRLLAESCGYRAHTLFSAAADPNLQMLVEADTVSPRGEQPTMDAGGCDETLRALNRFNWLTYHARWSYAAPRIAKLATYLYEHLTARRFVRELVHECRRSPAPPSASRAA
ncbi:MAG: class I SAM-dependent methyltransferase [Pirellulaceae bacterium]|nr:class I SAM-dependent methyltransferase [Pirellulaceae bacterium]